MIAEITTKVSKEEDAKSLVQQLLQLILWFELVQIKYSASTIGKVNIMRKKSF